ncbi:hypothetical protein B0H14DRAFT_2569379 [Mycena olivaceomarginata]|nr:hypothetical protein B0H14DRAFT_2569379 [Mycena olivaceomarginata]
MATQHPFAGYVVLPLSCGAAKKSRGQYIAIIGLSFCVQIQEARRRAETRRKDSRITTDDACSADVHRFEPKSAGWVDAVRERSDWSPADKEILKIVLGHVPSGVKERVTIATQAIASFNSVKPLFIVKATKVCLWCLTIPLPGIAPLVMAATPIHDSMSADDLLGPLLKVVFGLRNCNIWASSYACDGTETECSLQQKSVEKADKIVHYTITNPIPGAPDLVLSIAFFHRYPITDSPAWRNRMVLNGFSICVRKSGVVRSPVFGFGIADSSAARLMAASVNPDGFFLHSGHGSTWIKQH